MKHEWTAEEDAYLLEHFPNEPTIDVCMALGISHGTVCTRAKALGISKSPDFNPKGYQYRYVKNYKDKRYETIKKHFNNEQEERR